MMNFILITKTTTTIDNGLPNVVVSRAIRKLAQHRSEFNPQGLPSLTIAALEFARAALELDNPEMHFTLLDHGTTVSASAPAVGNAHVGYHYTPFVASDLPYYAKHLKAEELQEFIEYALTVGLNFKDV